MLSMKTSPIRVGYDTVPERNPSFWDERYEYEAHEGKRMRMLLIAFLSIATVLAGFAQAADTQDCIAQTWKGTIGSVPVMMQFDYIGEDGALVGRYYYRTSITDLLLVSDNKKPGRWKELDPKGKVTGYVALSCEGSSLSGTWSASDGSKTLPVSAGSLPADTFSKQRLAELKTVVTERGSIGKSEYELFSAQGFEAVKGLRLKGEGKTIADINNALLERYKTWLDEAIECKASGRLQRGEDHGFEYSSEMSMDAWNEAFVVIGESSSRYCGGLHPVYEEGATTYSLQTGKEEDVSQWLIESCRKDISKDSPLGKILMKIYESEEEKCADSIELSGENIRPTAEGMTFRPSAPYAATACIENITVPYRDMSPYLTFEGNKNVQVFEGR